MVLKFDVADQNISPHDDSDDSFHLYVGIDYPESFRDFVSQRLKFKKDALDIRDALKKDELRYNLLTGPVQLDLLLENIQQTLGPNNQGRDVMLYFAGHGTTTSRGSYYCCTDSQKDKKGSEGLSLRDLLELINRATSPSRIAVLLDFCYSGCPNGIKNNRLWLSASAEDGTSQRNFHNSLVSLLSSLHSPDIQTLQSYLSRVVRDSQPELVGRQNRPFILRKDTDRNLDFSDQDRLKERWLMEVTRSHTQRGRLRTAYPMDFSFSDLYTNSLYVTPHLGLLQQQTTTILEYQELAQNLINGDSILVIGDPGSGKSFLSYLIQTHIIDADVGAVSYTISEVLSEETLQFLRAIAKVAAHIKIKPIVLIDGLDEWGTSDKKVSQNLLAIISELSRSMSLLVICRREDYETRLFREVPSSSFSSLLVVKDWKFEYEFRSFISKLANFNYIEEPDILCQIIEKRPALYRLTSRPLYARMLTYVLAQPKFDNTDNNISLGSLYSNYL